MTEHETALVEATQMSNGVRAGALVVVVLREPREKFWGVLDGVMSAGVYLRCLDLNSFDDAMRATQAGEPLFGIASRFFPLWRVERIEQDAPSGTVPSLAGQFLARTRRSANAIFERNPDSAVDDIIG